MIERKPKLQDEALRVVLDSSDAFQRLFVDGHHFIAHLRDEQVPGYNLKGKG